MGPRGGPRGPYRVGPRWCGVGWRELKWREGGTRLLHYFTETDESCTFAPLGPAYVLLYGVFYPISSEEGREREQSCRLTKIE